MLRVRALQLSHGHRGVLGPLSFRLRATEHDNHLLRQCCVGMSWVGLGWVGLGWAELGPTALAFADTVVVIYQIIYQ